VTVVVGLDLSLTASGVGTIAGNTDGVVPVVSTDIVTSTKRTGQTLHDLDRRITRVVESVMDHVRDADLVVLEGPSYRSTDPGVWDRAHLWWSVVHRVHSAEIPLVIVPPTVVKKWATGKGGASKTAVVVAMARMWPDVELVDDNAADALALATIGAQRLGLVDALARHRAAVEALDWPESLAVSA
jgi:Holliday junction resolvasome RuvABC endonuclease subunit